MPPPGTDGDTATRRRRGYRAIESGDDDEAALARDSEHEPLAAEGEVEGEAGTWNAVGPEEAEREGWGALTYSFAASGAMTVGPRGDA